MADDPEDLDEGDRPHRRREYDEDRPARRRRPPDHPRAERPRGMTTTQTVLAVVGGLTLLGCCGFGGCVALVGIGSKQAADQEARDVAGGPAVTIDADALHAEYDANEVAADGKYKGKVLEVTGTVKEVKKGPFGGQEVELESSRNQFLSSVDCEFPDSAQGALAKLRKGQRVSIRGKCKGLLVGSVQLDNCVLK